MKLTLEPDHPIAKAIRQATTKGRVTLSVDTYDRDWNQHRALCLEIRSWSITGSGRHSHSSDLVFECEFVSNDEHRKFLAMKAPHA